MAETITAIVAVVGLMSAFCLWAVRQIVRGEIEPLREDVAVLRHAMFNHLAHGETPNEARIRERLGYDPR